MIKAHNSECKLVEKMIPNAGKFVNLVYCEDNGDNTKALEAYYYETNNKASHFHRSYRWVEGEKAIPKKFQRHYDELKSHINEVPQGHKLTL